MRRKPPKSTSAHNADAVGPPNPSLIHPEIREAADKLRRGKLREQMVERRYAAADPNVLPFLKAVAEGDEQRALATLRGLLACNPRLLEHPYVFCQFRHLFTVWHPLHDDLTDRAKVELVNLVRAWARGMTLGWKVTITKPPTGRRGQAPQHFPHLDDRDGWLPTEEADKERRDAEEFVRAYKDLKARLSKGVPWKMLRHRYGPSRPGPLYNAADKIHFIFEDFKRAHNIDAPPLERKALTEIARAGLTEPKRRNPADRAARGLVATLPWYNVKGVALTLTSSGIKSTLETLRKKEIGKPTSSG
ncbi:MAG: hypothetical protein HY727_14805 [Candidatus Rokubacteria bacterium]|nr:hypothetical protein [Candidatus Rokubacteria bacterium]